MSLTSLLSIARNAMMAHERAVGTVGHNIANAETPGYSRQRVLLQTATPETFLPFGQIGRGVEMQGIERIRSSFLDDSWRREASVQSQYGTLQQALEQVTGVLAEPGEAGLSASLDSMIDAFNTLASNPTDPAARAVAMASLRALTDKFHSIDARLESIAQNIGAEAGQLVSRANSLIHEIGELNNLIQAAGGNAPDLADRRDLAVDRLGQLVDIRVIDRGRGAVDVTVGGIQVVASGGGLQQLSLSGTGPYTLQLGDPPAPVNPAAGQIRGLFDAFSAIGTRGTSTTRATGLRGDLDDLALSIVSAVNQIHSGYDPGTKPLQPTITPAPTPLRTVGPLFDPAGVTAGTIAIDPAVLADPAQLAAGYSTAAGDNTIALRLAQLRNLSVPVPGSTGATAYSPAVAAGGSMILGEYYTGVVSALGVVTQDAGSRATSQSILVDHLESQRQAVSGVSIDEEMVRLIEHQQAYAAAARLIQVADDMLRELLELGR